MKNNISVSSRTGRASLVPVTPCGALVLLALTASISDAILVQPYNYMLDDSAMVDQHDTSGSLSPFLNDQSNEQQADKDIVSIIGNRLARLRLARMLEHQQQQAADEQSSGANQHFSPEMAEMLQSEQQQQQQQQQAKQDANDQQSLSSSMASMILNVAQAAASAAASDEQSGEQQQSGAIEHHGADGESSASRGSPLELDTSQASSGSPMASKADLKVAPSQWFNPKETIPVLKISSMATPSKYKKVYFRSEKKLVDGAFHSPASEQDDKKSLVKAFNSGVQRRSSRGSGASSAPPSILQDGVIDFLKKFRDVYVQTRPAGSGSASSNLVSSLSSAASPLASIVSRPNSSAGRPGSDLRPNFATVLQMASSIVSQAALPSSSSSSLGSSPSTSSSGSSSSSSSSSPANGSASPGSSLAGSSASSGGSALAAGSPSGSNKSPLSAQSYVSFWSKTFPTWVKKMLKQMRRRSLYKDSSKKRQHHALSQKIASGAVASVVESSANQSGSSGSSSQSSSSSSSS